MEDSRRAKQALHWIPDEKRKRGQSRTTWRDTVWRDVECMDITWQLGKTSVTRQSTEKNGKNGLPDVLVTGRTKV